MSKTHEWPECVSVSQTFLWWSFLVWLETDWYCTLLDISVISRVIYCISPSIILQIPFTVNNCNTLCIMGIFCDVRPHIQRITVFFKIDVYYCICCNGLFGAILLRSFYFPNFLHLDWHDLPYTVSTKQQQLGDDYTGCVTLLVMIGKSFCPSCQKQHERLEYYCTSEIYRCITLLSASTVDSIYNGFYIVFYRVVSEEDTEATGQRRGFCPGMNPREWKSSGEHLHCVSMHLTRE